MIAVLIENRPLPHLKKVIDRHMQFLPGWNFRHLKPDINTREQYSALLKRRAFWRQFKTEYILIFQHDSGLLRTGIEEFFGWDFVGAPWAKDLEWAREDRAGGNGGLSLRNVQAHLRLIASFKGRPPIGNEDHFFTHNLPNVAPYEVCRKFSVETEFCLGSMGYHAVEQYLSPDQVQRILTQYGEMPVGIPDDL